MFFEKWSSFKNILFFWKDSPKGMGASARVEHVSNERQRNTTETKSAFDFGPEPPHKDVRCWSYSFIHTSDDISRKAIISAIVPCRTEGHSISREDSVGAYNREYYVDSYFMLQFLLFFLELKCCSYIISKSKELWDYLRRILFLQEDATEHNLDISYSKIVLFCAESISSMPSHYLSFGYALFERIQQN